MNTSCTPTATLSTLPSFDAALTVARQIRPDVPDTVWSLVGGSQVPAATECTGIDLANRAELMRVRVRGAGRAGIALHACPGCGASLDVERRSFCVACAETLRTAGEHPRRCDCAACRAYAAVETRLASEGLDLADVAGL